MSSYKRKPDDRGNLGIGNTGRYNTGRYNSGNYNTGDYNSTSFSTGCFNTVEQKIMMFNKPSDWTYRDWVDSDAFFILSSMPEDREQVQSWWDSLRDSYKEKVMRLPNFDTEIFEEITGLTIK